MRKHAHRGGVDDHGGVIVLVEILVIILPGAGDHGDGGPLLPQHSLHRHRGAAGSQHQRLFSGQGNAAFLHHGVKSVGIGVVPAETAIEPAHHGVDAAQGGGHGRKLVA